MNEIDLSQVDLNLLVVFEAVFRERHVANAAKRLHVSPSAVSHGLGRLRELFDDPLFLRTPKEEDGHRLLTALWSARTETFWAVMLWTLAALAAFRGQATLFVLVLFAWQGAVYASALYMSWLNQHTVLSAQLERRRRSEWLRERSTIITTVTQMLFNYLDRGMSIEDAIAAPRASQRNTAAVTAEPAFIDAYGTLLEGYGHTLAPSGDAFTSAAEIGAATAIELGKKKRLTAVSEPTRRGGGSALVVRNRNR